MPTKQQQKDGLVQPIEPVTGSYRGETFVLNPREIFSSDHELVRKYPHLFRAVCATHRPLVEAATAAPGERRGSPE